MKITIKINDNLYSIEEGFNQSTVTYDIDKIIKLIRAIHDENNNTNTP